MTTAFFIAVVMARAFGAAVGAGSLTLARTPRTMRCSETVASLLVLLAGVVFSFGPLIFRSTSGEASAWQYMFWRFIGLGAVAGAGLIAMGVLLCRRPQPRWRDAGGGLMMCGCNVCFIVALDRVDAATVLLLQSLAPWSAALLGWALLREPVDKHTCLTMVLATAGVAIMGTDWGTADAVGLGAAITIAVLLGSYAVVIRASDARAGGYIVDGEAALPTDAVGAGETPAVAAAGAERLPNEPSSDGGVAMAVEGALLLAVWTALFGLIFSSLACRIAMPHTVRIATKDALLGATAGGFCLGVGLPLYSAAGKHIPAARTNLLLLSEILLGETKFASLLLILPVLPHACPEPVLAHHHASEDSSQTVVFALLAAPTWTWLAVGEDYGLRTLLGGALLLLALVWLALHPSKDDEGKQETEEQEEAGGAP
jgi:drug/metabolite transporter (DMT)-like permease